MILKQQNHLHLKSLFGLIESGYVKSCGSFIFKVFQSLENREKVCNHNFFHISDTENRKVVSYVVYSLLLNTIMSNELLLPLCFIELP